MSFLMKVRDDIFLCPSQRQAQACLVCQLSPDPGLLLTIYNRYDKINHDHREKAAKNMTKPEKCVIMKKKEQTEIKRKVYG